MSLIVLWGALDDKKDGPSVASLYFAADSRYSWGLTKKYNDYGQKVFGCTNSPEIFALCGDVNFPKENISNIVNEIDNKGLFSLDNINEKKKAKLIWEKLKDSLSTYNKSLIVQDFRIYYGTRTENGFHVFKYDYTKQSDNLVYQECPLPQKYSDIILSDGTGKKDFDDIWLNFNEKHNDYRTSRAVYHCIYETLSTTEEWTVGRIPQIVGLYRKFNCKFFGVVNNGKRYHFDDGGIKEIGDADLNQLSHVEWRNENFEVTDPYSMKLMEGAQAQPFCFTKQLPFSSQENSLK